MRRSACSSAALHRAALVAALLAACGTGSQDQKDPATEGTAATGGRGSGTADGSAGAGSAGTGAGPAGEGAAAAPATLPARGPERAAYSLIDNRLAAHVERGGGLVLPAGSAGFAKYVRFGNGLAGEKPAWLLRQREGDAPVARMTGGKARVHVPLTAEQAARGAVRIRAHAARAGALRVSANGHPPVTGPLDKGWSTVELALPAGQLAAGENMLELASAAPKLAVAWIHVGAAAPLPDDDALAVHDAGREALAIPDGGRMSWYVLVPEAARLTARVEAGCTVRVRATGEGELAAEGTLAGPAAAVDLAPLAGKAARLELLAAGCPRAVIEAAALTVPGEVPAIRRGEPPAHVVFLILDSLRFDRVHAFEPSARAETPVLDKLADSATLFLRHYVQGNESQVSHASMWTSMYLAKHRAARWQHDIPAKLVTLDDVVKRAKLYSAAATGNGYIRPSRGYGVGWNQYVNHIEKQLGLRGDAILERGLSFVAPRKDRPWFLYLGLIDTHVPWIGKPPWIERYSPGYTGRYAKGFRGGAEPGGVPKQLTAREQAHVRAIYDSNVSYQDALLGELIEQLEAWGVWDRTMLVITADHGDELWEDGRVGHEHGQDDTLLHVPLLVRYPPLFPAARIAHATEGIDVLPTIADALGVPPDDEWQGTSLVPAAHGAHAYAGLASASGYEKEHGARIGAWKLRLAGPADPALFHLATDPDEKQDVFGTPAGAIGGRLVLDAMSLLRAHHATWKKARWGNPGNVTPRFAADLGE